MSVHSLESLEKELYRSYGENLEINLKEDSPLFQEVMDFPKKACFNMKKLLNLN